MDFFKRLVTEKESEAESEEMIDLVHDLVLIFKLLSCCSPSIIATTLPYISTMNFTLL